VGDHLPLFGPLVLVLLITLIPVASSLSMRVLLRARPEATLEEAGSALATAVKAVLVVISRTLQSRRRSPVRPVSTRKTAGITQDPGS
jgi:hypothetical protein